MGFFKPVIHVYRVVEYLDHNNQVPKRITQLFKVGQGLSKGPVLQLESRNAAAIKTVSYITIKNYVSPHARPLLGG